MKIPSLSKQLSSDSKKKKNIQKSKLMKYKPRKGDQAKDWKIQGIVNERIVLRLKESQQKNHKQNESILHHSNDKLNIIPYQMIKQYEIAWSQDSQKGIWPNTWQPQQNIPEQTRLDYFIKKKNAILNKKKDTNNSLAKKSKQSLRRHIEFTMSKNYPKPQITDKRQRRKEGQRTIAQIQKDKSPPKIKKQQTYKDWFISYSSKTEGFEKLIKRFLKGQKNEDISKQFANNKKSKKAGMNIKKQFFENIRSMKEEEDAQLIDIIPKSNRNNMQDESIDVDVLRSTYVPKSSCLKLITDIAYFCQKDDVSYFRLKTQDGESGYISEDDLAKYLPFSYEQLLSRTICQKINECIAKVQKINIDGDNDIKYLEKLGNQIGIQKNYFQYIDSQCQNDKHSYYKSRHNQQKISLFKDLPDVLRKNRFFNEETQKFFSSNVDQINLSDQKQKNKTQSINEVINYFDILNKKSDQNLVFQMELNQVLQSQKQNDEIRLLNSKLKNLFNQIYTVEEDINKHDLRRSKIQKANNNDKKQTKVQKVSATKKLVTPKKIQPQVELQAFKSSPQKKKTNSPKFNKLFNSAALYDMKKPTNTSSKKPQKIKTQQDQLNQILGSISESQNQQEMFYGSEDEQNQK